RLPPDNEASYSVPVSVEVPVLELHFDVAIPSTLGAIKFGTDGAVEAHDPPGSVRFGTLSEETHGPGELSVSSEDRQSFFHSGLEHSCISGAQRPSKAPGGHLRRQHIRLPGGCPHTTSVRDDPTA